MVDFDATPQSCVTLYIPIFPVKLGATPQAHMTLCTDLYYNYLGVPALFSTSGLLEVTVR